MKHVQNMLNLNYLHSVAASLGTSRSEGREIPLFPRSSESQRSQVSSVSSLFRNRAQAMRRTDFWETLAFVTFEFSALAALVSLWFLP